MAEKSDSEQQASKKFSLVRGKIQTISLLWQECHSGLHVGVRHVSPLNIEKSVHFQ